MSYTHVAWMGGSFAPPTTAHIAVARDICKFLQRYGSNVALLIVPVSQAYNKPSVKKECLPNDVRWRAIEAFQRAVAEDNPVAVKLLDYEFKKNEITTTYNSLQELKSYVDAENVFLALGQDNMEQILQRKWSNSEALLNEFSFIIYPRGQNDKMALGDANKFHVLKSTFSDEISSTAVRRLCKEISTMLHPYVREALDLRLPYLNPACENQQTGSVNKKTRKRRPTKRQS